MEWRKVLTLFIVVCISAFSPKLLQAQKSPSRTEKQPWLTGNLPPTNGSYRYLVAHGEGKSIGASREDARLFLLIELGFSKGVQVQSKRNIQMESEDKFSNGNTIYDETTKHIDSYKIEGNGYRMSFAAVDEYYERNRDTYQIWVLYQVAEKEFTPVLPEYTNSYGFGAVWRSAIVPGWGQFYKKQSGKGLSFLATKSVLIGTAIYSDMQYTSNVRRSRETTNLTVIKEYRNRADQWQLRRNIAIGATVGVYVWNVLDAALAKGKIKYAWIPDKLNMTACCDTKNQQLYGLTFNF